MIKIILSDIDGTFLKNDKTFTALHARAIKSVVAKGLKFVFVSARMPEAIYPITDAIGMAHTPVISYSGGQFFSTKKFPPKMRGTFWRK